MRHNPSHLYFENRFFSQSFSSLTIPTPSVSSCSKINLLAPNDRAIEKHRCIGAIRWKHFFSRKSKIEKSPLMPNTSGGWTASTKRCKYRFADVLFIHHEYEIRQFGTDSPALAKSSIKRSSSLVYLPMTRNDSPAFPSCDEKNWNLFAITSAANVVWDIFSLLYEVSITGIRLKNISNIAFLCKTRNTTPPCGISPASPDRRESRRNRRA